MSYYYYLSLKLNFDFFHLLYILYYLEFFFEANYWTIFENYFLAGAVVDPAFGLFERDCLYLHLKYGN